MQAIKIKHADVPWPNRKIVFYFAKLDLGKFTF